MAAPQPKFILFSSSASKAGRQAEEFLRKAVPTIKIIRLDTKEQRDRAKHGTYFSIQSVPTLVLQFPNGQFQFLVGLGEINRIFSPPSSARPSSSSAPRNRSRNASRGGGNMYDDPDGWRRGHSDSEESLEEPDGFSSDEGPPRGRPRDRRIAHEESSDASEEEIPQPPPKRGKKVRISEPKKPSPKTDTRKKGRADADRKLAAAKKASGGEGITSSQKRGRAEATKKLSVLGKKSKPPNRMGSVLAKAKEQEGFLKQALD